MWRTEGSWEHVKGMKGHRDLVSSMSAHPSGKVALSVSRDKQMRLWDLTKGSCAYQAALGADGDLVGFFPGGDMYYVACSDPSTAKGSKVSLHSIQVSCLYAATLTFFSCFVLWCCRCCERWEGWVLWDVTSYKCRGRVP